MMRDGIFFDTGPLELLVLNADLLSGFDISIDHPHTHVVKCTQLVKGK